MYTKLILFLLSFAMLACSGAGVSMQGKGFEEFPNIEIPEEDISSMMEYPWAQRLVSVKDSVGVIAYGFTWIGQSILDEELTWAQRPDAAYEKSPYGVVDPARQEGSVVVDVKRQRFGKLEAEALSLAGFELKADGAETIYTKEIGKTFYMTVFSHVMAPDMQLDSYGYLIEKPKTDIAKVAALFSWPDRKGFRDGYTMILVSKAALAEVGDDIGDYTDMETVLATLETVGFIEDSSILNDAKQKALVGALTFSPEEEWMRLEIGDIDAIRLLQ